jgi:hypothetical protein
MKSHCKSRWAGLDLANQRQNKVRVDRQILFGTADQGPWPGLLTSRLTLRTKACDLGNIRIGECAPAAQTRGLFDSPAGSDRVSLKRTWQSQVGQFHEFAGGADLYYPLILLAEEKVLSHRIAWNWGVLVALRVGASGLLLVLAIFVAPIYPGYSIFSALFVMLSFAPFPFWRSPRGTYDERIPT